MDKIEIEYERPDGSRGSMSVDRYMLMVYQCSGPALRRAACRSLWRAWADIRAAVYVHIKWLAYSLRRSRLA